MYNILYTKFVGTAQDRIEKSFGPKPEGDLLVLKCCLCFRYTLFKGSDNRSNFKFSPHSYYNYYR